MTSSETTDSGEITQRLIRWRDGDESALEDLTRLIYAELRRLAGWMLKSERPGHTLQPTALVHELYLRLVPTPGIDWKCRSQFFSIAANVMRRILVDHARRRSAGKRTTDEPIALGEELMSLGGQDILEVDFALSRLAKDHPRQAQVVELRFFGGLTNEEIVEAMRTTGEQVSLRTVERDWRFSRAWLQDAIGNPR
jgi:RNA polymerase sigma factor (TIGR02999 family)